MAMSRVSTAHAPPGPLVAGVREVARIRSPAAQPAARDVGPRSCRVEILSVLVGAQPDLTGGSGGPVEMDAYRLNRPRELKTSL